MLCVLLAGCGGGEKPQTLSSSSAVPLNSAPTSLRWTDFQGMSIPAAAQGPHHTDEVAPHGFDRTPPGAALAAINATIRLSVATDDQWPTVVRTLVAPGTARDAFITARIQLSTTAPVPAGQAPKVLGWKVVQFSPQRATVDIYSRLPDNSMTVNHSSVVWTAFGDWGLLLPYDAAASSPVSAITSLPSDLVRL